MAKRVLGLDIGITSVGWAVIDFNESKFIDDNQVHERIVGGDIIASGVRIFQQPIDRNSKSLAKIRGESRRTRATIERRAERLKYLINLATQYDIIDDSFSIANFDAKKGTLPDYWSVWRLRVDALDRQLSNFELFRVLYHIANHRGAYFLTKAEQNSINNINMDNLQEIADDEKAKEDKKVKDAIKRLSSEYTRSGYRTIGEYIYNKEGKKRNTSGDYTLSIRREYLRDEVELILETQRNFNEKLSKEFQDKYIDEVLMRHHPLDETKLQNMMGKCDLIKDETCAPKKGYSAEMFTLYNRLNNLKLGKQKELINQSQREIIIELAKKKEKITFTDLRNELKLDYDTLFNLCDYREDNPEYSKAITIKRDKISDIKQEDCDLYSENGEVVDNFHLKLIEDVQKVFNNYPKLQAKKYYYYDIRRMYKDKLKDELRFSKLKSNYIKSRLEVGDEKYYKQFEKDTFVSLSGYHLLKKGLGDYFENLTNEQLDIIAESLVYYKSDDTREKYLKENGIIDDNLISKILYLDISGLATFSKKAYKLLNREMEKGFLFHEAKEMIGFSEDIPVKSVKIAEYTGFYGKNPTVARVLSQCRKVVNAINRVYGKDKPIDEIHVEVATEVANSKKKVDAIARGQRRYKEQKDTALERCIEANINPNGANLLKFRLAEEQDFRCIYSGKGIVIGSPSSDDFVNILDCEVDHIVPISRSFDDSLNNKVLCTAKSNQDKQNMLPYEWFGNDEKRWTLYEARINQLNRIRSVKKRNLLRKTYTDEDKENFISRNLNDTRYATRHVAEYLREHYDFSSSQVDINEKMRVQTRSGGITAKLRHLWGLEKNRDESYKHHALDAIVVACANMGHIYYLCSVMKEKYLKQRENMLPWTTFREDVKKSLDKVFVSRMVRCSATGVGHSEVVNPLKKAYKDAAKKGRQPSVDEIQKIKDKLSSKQNQVELKRYNSDTIDFSLSNMFRLDIYLIDNKYKIVPIYAIDLHRKDFKHYYQPYEYDRQGDLVEAKESNFIFSLYKDSFVKIATSNEIYEGYIDQYNAQSGQLYISSSSGDNIYEISTSTLSIGDCIKFGDRGLIIDSFNEGLGLLNLDGGIETIIAKPKKEGASEYKTDIKFIRLDSEKKINASTFVKLQKFDVDPLGNIVEVKKEKERFINKMKSNSIRYKERRLKKQQRE